MRGLVTRSSASIRQPCEERRRNHHRDDHRDDDGGGPVGPATLRDERADLPVAEQDDAGPGFGRTSRFPGFSTGLAKSTAGALARLQCPVPSLHDERRVIVPERPTGSDDGPRARGKEGAGQAQRPFAGDERAVRRLACRQHDQAAAEIERGDLVGLQPSVLMVVAGCGGRQPSAPGRPSRRARERRNARSRRSRALCP